MQHELKILPQYFAQKIKGLKAWEHRKNDRDFKLDDTLWLREWSEETGYTGRSIYALVCFIHDLGDGYVIMSDMSIGNSYLLKTSH